MARCPDCAKFVSYGDEPEVELDNVDCHIEGDTWQFTGELLVTLQCNECGTDLRQTAIDIDESLQYTCLCGVESIDRDAEIKEETADPLDEMQPSIPRVVRGKVARGSKAAKHYYGAQVEITAQCPDCKADVTYSGAHTEQASNFDDLT